MIVDDILQIAKVRLHSYAVSSNDAVLIKFIYLGMNELYNRFNLSIKSETVHVTSDRGMYELQNPDVSMLLSLFDISGKELKQTDVLNSLWYDYKIVNYRSFVLKKSFEGILYAIYKGSAVPVKDPMDTLDIPDTMTDALLTYVTYMATSTINRDGVNESMIYKRAFDFACTELEMQGYKIPLSTETYSVRCKGFV